MGYDRTAIQTVSAEAIFRATTMAVVVVAAVEVEVAEETVTTVTPGEFRSRSCSVIA